MDKHNRYWNKKKQNFNQYAIRCCDSWVYYS